MAKFQAARFTDAAVAYHAKFGVVPSASEAGEKVSDTQANARALAAELGEAHTAHAGLLAVATLRESVGRRFIRLAVAPLAAKPKRASRAKGGTK